jgi:HAD superfamily phosphoserine phosphatase-like hydrolase
MTKLKKDKLAIFDIDGTVFRLSLMVELMKELVYDGIFPEEAKKLVEKEYHDWVNRKSSYQLYIEKVVKVFEKMIKGCRQDEVIASGIKVISYFRDRRYVYARNLLEKLRKTHFLLSISGSPVEIVKAYNSYLKFDKMVGTIFEVDKKGKYTGKVLLNGAQEKKKIFDNFIKESKINLTGSIGIGDTEYDSAFLDRVDRPIAFNPNSNLVKIAEKNGWEIVIEKKDIICEIKNGRAKIRKYKF